MSEENTVPLEYDLDDDALNDGASVELVKDMVTGEWNLVDRE